MKIAMSMALFALVLAFGCGKVVFDPQGIGGSSAGRPADGGPESDAGSLCTPPDAGSLAGFDCYSGCALCVAEGVCGGEIGEGECVAFCLANVELALHSPCWNQFDAWMTCVTGSSAFCGCFGTEAPACDTLWDPWASCIDAYCPGVNTPDTPCHPVPAPAACALGLHCEDDWPCSNYVAGERSLVCVDGVCVAPTCGSDVGTTGPTCCTFDLDCAGAWPWCSLQSSYCDTTTVATGTCTPGGG